MLSHKILNKFYVLIRINFDTLLNKTETKLLSILIFARPFPSGKRSGGRCNFQNSKPSLMFIVNGKNLSR